MTKQNNYLKKIKPNTSEEFKKEINDFFNDTLEQYIDLDPNNLGFHLEIDISKANKMGKFNVANLHNTNELLSSIAEIKKESYILDAGCGVGGTCIWLAKNIGCKCIGITLSQRQLEYGEKLIKEQKIEELVTLKMMDYLDTEFNENTFDAIFALQSLTHAEDKEAFFLEMARILKPMGKIIILDGFLINKMKMMDSEKNIFKKLLDGWAAPVSENFLGYYLSDIEKYLESCGFRKVLIEDVAKYSIRSARNILHKSIFGILPTYLKMIITRKKKYVNEYKNIMSTFRAVILTMRGMASYYLMYYVKK